MSQTISRREFLKLSSLSLGGLAFRPLFGQGEDPDTGDIARVAIRSVSVYSKPSDKSKILYQRHRDELINIYDEIVSPDGPGYNPVWYKVWRGYIHSAYLQRVKVRLNAPVKNDQIPQKRGQLAEVTVPMTTTMRYLAYKKAWEPIYRLYYNSTHWIKGVDTGPDGMPWYRLHDELTELEYHAPAEHFRLIQPDEFAPISPEVEPWHKRIEVSLSQQQVTAYENEKIVMQAKVSTGVPDRLTEPGHIPTDTPSGQFNVYSKMPSKHMGNGEVTSDIEAYELPGAPWTTFFDQHGVPFHGTYWHTNYGMMMSHGCVNLRPEDAKWIFRWTTPVVAPDTWEQTGYGTLVIVK
ncbi:MAG: L,D-transpeptidase [Anaerolineaceae bacterium]|nr:L,D-transpeptidase [Anaerolineaceae bacterium]